MIARSEGLLAETVHGHEQYRQEWIEEDPEVLLQQVARSNGSTHQGHDMPSSRERREGASEDDRDQK